MTYKKFVEYIMSYFIGVDLHNESFYAHVIDAMERKVDGRKVPTTDKDIRKYFEPYRDLDAIVAVEAGNPTFDFCDILEEMGIKFVIVNTLDYSRTSNNKKKTDKRDARNLAFDLKRNNLPAVAVFKPDLVQRTLRALVTQRNQYVKDRTRTVNRTYSFLVSRGVKVKKRSLKDSLKNWEALFARLNDQPRSDSILPQLRLYHQDFKRFKEQVKTVEADILTLIKEHYLQNYNRMNTLSGIGVANAACMIGLVGDFKRFKSAKHLASYFGLVPSNRQTGDRNLKGHGRITKEGSSLMRSYLLQGTLSIIASKKEKDRPLKEWYQNIKKRKGWKKAKVALARKMCEILFAMIRNGVDYDPALVTKNSKPVL